jgi:hypothetical protein
MSDTQNLKDTYQLKSGTEGQSLDMFVLDKSIFSNIFDKDIKRVYVYKKAERLAKAIHLVAPAFRSSPALRDRIDRVAVGLVDAAVLPPALARDGLSRELLSLSSVLSIARVGGLLSAMNADLIAREAQLLLQEVAGYEEPRLFLEDAPTLAELARASKQSTGAAKRYEQQTPIGQIEGQKSSLNIGQYKGHSDKGPSKSSRKDSILSVLASRGPSYIKDISLVVRDVSEKTIQRELQTLVLDGSVAKTGERRWTVYAIAGAV